MALCIELVCKPPARKKKRAVAALVYSGCIECLCTSVKHILLNRVPFISFLSLDMPTSTIWTDFQHRPCRAMRRDGWSNTRAAQFLVWARLLLIPCPRPLFCAVSFPCLQYSFQILSLVSFFFLEIKSCCRKIKTSHFKSHQSHETGCDTDQWTRRDNDERQLPALDEADAETANKSGEALQKNGNLICDGVVDLVDVAGT